MENSLILLDTASLRALVTQVFDQFLPFNHFLGMDIRSDEGGKVEIHLPWKDELMGNPIQKILHGGVTASVLDTIGGLVAILQAVNDMPPMTKEDFEKRFRKMGTIDIRVDYLRPGKGDSFVATAEVIRKGARVAVCRMELHNDQGEQIAFGTGTYMVG